MALPRADAAQVCSNASFVLADGQCECCSLVDAINISNQMQKHRNAVSFAGRLQTIGCITACNVVGSSSLYTRMNAAARLMQPLRYTPTHLKISQRFLQHASNVQHTQALTRQMQRTARAPLQQHLHFLHETPRHTLHNPRSTASHPCCISRAHRQAR